MHDAGGQGGIRLHSTWVSVFALNLPVPLILGWGFTPERGRFGMFGAIFLLLALGSYLCARATRLGRAMVVGGAIVALSQFYPAAQMGAGIIGLSIGQAIGQVAGDLDGVANVTSESGGLFVTSVTGGLLMTVALALGGILKAFTPGRWWGEPGSKRPQPHDWEL